jgi:glycogen debranching enzyme
MTPERLSEAYGVFSRLAAWWLAHRVASGDRLPHYLHGNDSGWDNSTIFDAGVPLIAPDLAALLALHCEELADLATQLGEIVAAEWWRRTARRLSRDLIDTLWQGDRFVALRLSHRGGVPHREIVESDSLITCLPLVLGRRLPESVADALVARIRRFVTDYGVATELPSSPQYVPDGYWRGPIWAPSTLLVVSGLGAVGETALARRISEGFCRACAENGFAENFDALTGAGLRDPAYTWTASVFMVLARAISTGDFII